MQTPGNIEELKNAIQLTGDKKSIDGKLLRDHFLMTCETLKPGNLLTGKIKEVATGRNLVRLVAGTALSLTTGYLSKKIVVGISAIVLRGVLAGILQFSAARIFSKNARVPDFFGKNNHQRLSEKSIP